MTKVIQSSVLLAMLWLAGCGGSNSGVQIPTETPPPPPETTRWRQRRASCSASSTRRGLGPVGPGALSRLREQISVLPEGNRCSQLRWTAMLRSTARSYRGRIVWDWLLLLLPSSVAEPPTLTEVLGGSSETFLAGLVSHHLSSPGSTKLK
jgi:hypothetical protein